MRDAIANTRRHASLLGADAAWPIRRAPPLLRRRCLLMSVSRMGIFILTAAAVGTLTACATILGIDGDYIDLASDPDASASNGVAACRTPPGACVNGLPSGWKLVAFANSRNLACPAGLEQKEVVTAPVAGAGACDCSCTLDATPSCHKGAMRTAYSTDDSCDKTGASVNVNGTGCTALNGSLSTYFAGHPVDAVAHCTATATADKTKVTVAQQRYCDIPRACQEDVCNGDAGNGFSACIATEGDVACPSGWDTRTVVGDDVTLSCAACTGCSASASCTGGKLQFFSDSSCNTPLVTVDVNDTCVSTNGGGNIKSFLYSATPANVQCTGTGPKTGTVGLAAPRTICCK